MKSNIKIRLEWKPEDLWIGAFWRRSRYSTDIWICLLPCVPIRITFWRVECPNCGALVKALGESSDGGKFCCVHCAFNPSGCRCRFGELGVCADPQAYYCDEEDD